MLRVFYAIKCIVIARSLYKYFMHYKQILQNGLIFVEDFSFT